jgi:hypothetical protein
MIRHGHSTKGRVVDQVIERLTRVLKLDSTVFKEIADDESATGPAVGIAALASAIGGISGDTGVVSGIIFGAIFGAIGLFVWTGLVFLTGKLFGGKAPYIQLVRPIGFAAAPFVLGILPILGIVGLAYSLVIQVRAVREVNEVGDGSAVATVLLPFGVLFIIGVLLALLVGFALLSAFGA